MFFRIRSNNRYAVDFTLYEKLKIYLKLYIFRPHFASETCSNIGWNSYSNVCNFKTKSKQHLMFGKGLIINDLPSTTYYKIMEIDLLIFIFIKIFYFIRTKLFFLSFCANEFPGRHMPVL